MSERLVDVALLGIEVGVFGLEKARGDFGKLSQDIDSIEKKTARLRAETRRADPLASADRTPARVARSPERSLSALQRDVRALEGATRSMGLAFADAFGDAILKGEDLRRVTASLVRDLGEVARRGIVGSMSTPSAAATSHAGSTGSSDVIGSVLRGLGGWLGDILPFADGGRPPVGRPSLVGERGPELFVPDRPGRIIANSALHDAAAGSGGVTVVQNINVSTGVQATVRAEINALRPRLAEDAKRAVLEARLAGGRMASVFSS